MINYLLKINGFGGKILLLLIQIYLLSSSDGFESRLVIDSTLTRHFLADSYSILLDESRLGLDQVRLFKTGLAWTQPITTTDGSKSRLGIYLTLTLHFLADTYSILLDKSRLGLDRAQLFKTLTGSDSTHHYY